MAIKSKSRHDLTLRSIKREIAAGRDVAYWLDKADTHLDSGLLRRTTLQGWKPLHRRTTTLWMRKTRRTLRKSHCKEA